MPTRKRQIKHDQIVNAFAERLRELRAERGMTQKQLAAAAKVTLSYVSKLESAGAAPGLDLMQRLATALGVEIAEFLPKSISPAQDDQRKAVRQQFDEVVAKSGERTLAAIEVLLTHLANSSVLGR